MQNQTKIFPKRVVLILLWLQNWLALIFIFPGNNTHFVAGVSYSVLYMAQIYSVRPKLCCLIFYVHYTALFHLPPLRFHCVGGCWDRTQGFSIGSLIITCFPWTRAYPGRWGRAPGISPEAWRRTAFAAGHSVTIKYIFYCTVHVYIRNLAISAHRHSQSSHQLIEDGGWERNDGLGV